MKHPKPGSLDHIDSKILQTLLTDGRISNADLAERVGLSSTPCWNRVRRLEREGFITGYGARLDQKLLGVPETVIIEVTLEKHDDQALERFGEAVVKLPEVLEVYLTTGEYDYLLKAAVANTQAFEYFLRKRLFSLPGIRQSRSSFTLRCLKQSHGYIPFEQP